MSGTSKETTEETATPALLGLKAGQRVRSGEGSVSRCRLLLAAYSHCGGGGAAAAVHASEKRQQGRARAMCPSEHLRARGIGDSSARGIKIFCGIELEQELEQEREKAKEWGNSNGSALKHLVMILEFRGGYNHRRPVRPRLSSALTATMSFRFYLFENLLQNPKGFVSKGSSELLDAAFNSVCECLIIPSDCYSRPYGRKGTLYEFVSPFLIKLRTFLL
ncbi:hypothetical protein AXG93_3545s1160 [Marchantia polymorpha subsp. ruderalis]|uniref:Uncharacterized protein n=1 Tax=Marchantia polymorpha subsp. ruderalis TaxID=1480154 RepID=A0A176VX82_MARPO|nr:hypothetical protein AXG93_3545s1160 [Marchantia polymorpha subsp. ruderalis]